VAPPQTPLWELTALPQTPKLYLRGLFLSKGMGKRGRGKEVEGKEREKEGKGRRGEGRKGAGIRPPIFRPRTAPERNPKISSVEYVKNIAKSRA